MTLDRWDGITLQTEEGGRAHSILRLHVERTFCFERVEGHNQIVSQGCSPGLSAGHLPPGPAGLSSVAFPFPASPLSLCKAFAQTLVPSYSFSTPEGCHTWLSSYPFLSGSMWHCLHDKDYKVVLTLAQHRKQGIRSSRNTRQPPLGEPLPQLCSSALGTGLQVWDRQATATHCRV